MLLVTSGTRMTAMLATTQRAALRAISGQHADTFTGFFSLRRQGISQTHGVLPQCGKLYFL
jgi:hypothetical protein